MFEKSRERLLRLRWGIAALLIAAAGLMVPAPASAQLSGAVFTTDVACNGTDLNIYGLKTDVYLDGGPHHTGSAGLPDGEYYVQVTAPGGGLLGTSLGTADETPVLVVGGEFVVCYQLTAILNVTPGGAAGYADTTNAGGEYKVWVSTVSTFDNSSTKTDNFKVMAGGGVPPESIENLLVQKFYDANANGVKDGTETFIIGWKVNISGCINQDDFTEVFAIVEPGLCTVREYMPSEPNWIRTLPSATDTITVTAVIGQTAEVLFGNVCLGADHGHTLGFWSNKNGQALISADLTGNLAALSALNLVDASGNPFNPTTYAQFRTWILGANATNMAYMLSAQLAAMKLNVMLFGQDANAIIYAPGTVSGGATGFATLSAVMDEANTMLEHHPVTLGGSPHRAHQEALKDALDDANNNLNFVQPTACPFTEPWAFSAS